MSALRLFDRGTRTAAVLVQRPAWCLSEMRWPRPDADLRRGTRGRTSGAVAGRRRDPFVGQAQSVLLAFRHLARRTLRFRSRSEEHTSELQSLMRISYAVFCLKKK